MNRNAFVTGGTGFIGINLIHQLVKKGWKVTALHRPTSDLCYLKELPVNLTVGSVTDYESLLDAIPKNADVVFHLAGDTNMWSRHNKRQTRINVDGTDNMIRAAVQKGIRTFIHTSSVAAWGDVSGTVTEETPQKGMDSWVNYEYTKWAGEQKALEGLQHGLKVVIMNPSEVMGPYDTGNWGRLFFALRDGDLPAITNGCMSVTHVRSVVEAQLAAVEKGRNGEKYILGGVNCHFSDLLKEVASVAGHTHIPKQIPAALFKTIAYLQAGLSYITQKEPDLTPELSHMMTRKNVGFSSQKAMDELGYHIPPLHRSVSDCYEWLKKEDLL